MVRQFFAGPFLFRIHFLPQPDSFIPLSLPGAQSLSCLYLLHKMLDIALKSGYVYISSELFRPNKYDKWVQLLPC
jgi:hypothetical protein